MAVALRDADKTPHAQDSLTRHLTPLSRERAVPSYAAAKAIAEDGAVRTAPVNSAPRAEEL
jgi:hypothetical protein